MVAHDDAGGLLPIKRTIRGVIDAHNQPFRDQEVSGGAGSGQARESLACVLPFANSHAGGKTGQVPGVFGGRRSSCTFARTVAGGGVCVLRSSFWRSACASMICLPLVPSCPEPVQALLDCGAAWAEARLPLSAPLQECGPLQILRGPQSCPGVLLRQVWGFLGVGGNVHTGGKHTHIEVVVGAECSSGFLAAVIEGGGGGDVRFPFCSTEE